MQVRSRQICKKKKEALTLDKKIQRRKRGKAQRGKSMIR